MRHLLALFALLTGLTVLTEPVRAAEPRVTAVRMEQGLASQVQSVPAVVRLANRSNGRVARQPVKMLARLAYRPPAVVLQVDRARE